MSGPLKYFIAAAALALVIGGIVVISGPSRAEILVQNHASQPITSIRVTYPLGDTLLRDTLAPDASRRVIIEVGEASYTLEVVFLDGRSHQVTRYVQGGYNVLETVSDSGIVPTYDSVY